MRRLLTLPFLLLTLLLSGRALGEPLAHLAAKDLVAIPGERGYTGSEIDDDGDVIVRMSGYRVLPLLGSYQGKSPMARIALAGTGADCAWANRWHRDMRLARVYLDQEGDPVREKEIAFEGGIERANLAHFPTRYGRLLERFVQRLPRRG